MAGGRILLVDDNPVNLKLTCVLLKSAGYEVGTSGTAEEAIEMLPAFQPRLIITDIQLPGIDGLEFTRRIKSNAELQAIQVVALTALDSPGDEARIREAGCDGYLAKPVEAKSLIELARTYFEMSVPNAVESPPSATIDALRRQFLAEGERECRQLIAQFLPRLVAPVLSMPDLRSALHRWAGAGGALGFPTITAKAREAEALLVQPLEHVRGELRLVLGTLFTLFQNPPAPVEPVATRPAAVPSRLAGYRFALLNFDVKALAVLRVALENAGAFYRAIPAQSPAPSAETFRPYDIAICNLASDAAQNAEAAKTLLEAGVPRLFVGRRELADAANLSMASLRQEFQADPWNVGQLLGLCEALLGRAREASGTVPGKKIVVLICDDDQIVRSLISAALEEHGIASRTADNGRQALAMARNDPPDAIVLDVNMPRMNGLDVLAELRKLELTRKIPVMLLTGCQEKKDVVRGLRLGANDYVINPGNPHALVVRLKELLPH